MTQYGGCENVKEHKHQEKQATPKGEAETNSPQSTHQQAEQGVGYKGGQEQNSDRFVRGELAELEIE